MNICMVGGIYGTPEAYRHKVRYTPETILEGGLRSLGHSVTTLSHYDTIPDTAFDVVHVHHLSWGAVRAACNDSKPRFVFTPHDPRAMSGGLSVIRHSATRFVIARADAVVALSNLEVAHQRNTYDLRDAMQVMIPNGIDLGMYSYAPRRSARQRCQGSLLYVGQLNQLKRVDVLLRALPLCPGHLELKVAFHIDSLRPDLERLAAKLGMASRVHFLGPKNPCELAQLYHDADILVLPSAGEALPSVITEAMACGTPVIATRVGGIPEQLGGYGLLVSPGDAEELAQAIRHVLDNYRTYAAQGEAMSRFAQQRFSPEQMVARHLQLYEQLLRQGSLPRRFRVNRAFTAAARCGIELPTAWRRRKLRAAAASQ